MIELSVQQKKAFDLFVIERKSMKDVALALGVSYSRAINLLNEILIKTGLKSRKDLLAEGANLEITVKQ